MAYDAARHVRWIVLASDGRHSTLGRDTAPSDAEVAAAATVLAQLGLTGWLVRLEGDYWSRHTPVVLTMLEPLARAAEADRPAAGAAFEVMREVATKRATK